VVRFIAIEGVIGAGKTTLARMLGEELDAHLLLEVVEENPFLSSFYRDRRKYAFQTQLFFLLSRYQQYYQLFQEELFTQCVIADYLFAKDRIFAVVNLDDNELALYDKIANLLEQRIPIPDLVIYLQASPEFLLSRIKKRGRAFERHITIHYLEELCTAYNEYFFAYSASPLLIVNAEEVDFAGREEDFRALLEEIKSPVKGVRYWAGTRRDVL